MNTTLKYIWALFLLFTYSSIPQSKIFGDSLKSSLDSKQLNTSEEIFELGVYYFQKNELNNSKKYFDEYIRIIPDDKAVLKYLGQIAIAEHNITEVEYYYDMVYTQDSTDADALLNLGVINLNSGNYDYAEEFLLKSMFYDPDNILTQFNLGILYGNKGNLSKALFYLNKVILSDPQYENAYYTMGAFYLLNNNEDEAKRSFQNALKLNSHSADSRAGLIILYERLNELEKAETELKILDTEAPWYPQINILKANLFYLRKDYANATRFVLEEIKTNDSNPDNYYLLNQLYEIKGNKVEADSAFASAKALKARSIRSNSNQNLFNLLAIKLNYQTNEH